MIIGECPYPECDGVHFIPVAPHCPAFSKEKCEVCGKDFWVLHSHVTPDAFTLEQFALRYHVDEDTKRITELVKA